MSTAKSHSPPSSRILCHELVGDVVDTALPAGDGRRLEPVVHHVAVLAVVVAVEVHERRRPGSPCRSALLPHGLGAEDRERRVRPVRRRLARSRRCPCGGSAPRAGRTRRSRRAAPAGSGGSPRPARATHPCRPTAAGRRTAPRESSEGMVGISNSVMVMGPIRQRAGGGRGIASGVIRSRSGNDAVRARSATS